MSEPFDGAQPPPILTPGLEQALHNAFSETLGSLDVLRKSIRSHVHTKRDRGASLAEIDGELRGLIERAEASAQHDGDGALDGELSAQIMKWTKAFFG